MYTKSTRFLKDRIFQILELLLIKCATFTIYCSVENQYTLRSGLITGDRQFTVKNVKKLCNTSVRKKAVAYTQNPRSTDPKDDPIYFEDLPGPSYVYLPDYLDTDGITSYGSRQITNIGPQSIPNPEHHLMMEPPTQNLGSINTPSKTAKLAPHYQESPDDVREAHFNGVQGRDTQKHTGTNPFVVYKTAPVTEARPNLPDGECLRVRLGNEPVYIPCLYFKTPPTDKSYESRLFDELHDAWVDFLEASVSGSPQQSIPTFDVKALVEEEADHTLSKDEILGYAKSTITWLVTCLYLSGTNMALLSSFLQKLKLYDLSISLQQGSCPGTFIKELIIKKISNSYKTPSKESDIRKEKDAEHVDEKPNVTDREAQKKKAAKRVQENLDAMRRIRQASECFDCQPIPEPDTTEFSTTPALR